MRNCGAAGIEVQANAAGCILQSAQKVGAMDVDRGRTITIGAAALQRNTEHFFACGQIAPDDGCRLEARNPDRPLQSEGAENLDAVRGKADAGADLGELARLLEDVCLESSLAESDGGRQAADAATNDSDAQGGFHNNLLATAQSSLMPISLNTGPQRPCSRSTNCRNSAEVVRRGSRLSAESRRR